MSNNDEREIFTREDALQVLSDGHSIVAPAGVAEICQVLGIPTVDYTPYLMIWQTKDEAMTRYSFFPVNPQGEGVGLLELGYVICEALGIDPPGRGFTGKGFQARANAQAIREYLEKRGEE